MDSKPSELCELLVQEKFFTEKCRWNKGIYGQDSPLGLLKQVLSEMPKDLDYIFMNGDFVKHSIALPDGQNATED